MIEWCVSYTVTTLISNFFISPIAFRPFYRVFIEDSNGTCFTEGATVCCARHRCLSLRKREIEDKYEQDGSDDVFDVFFHVCLIV